jgi:hypothetical protein
MAPERTNPSSTNPSIKDPHLFDKLVDDVASPHKAARISNAAARDGRSAVGHRGGESGSYEEWTVHGLRGRAKELGLRGYSRLKKSDLISQLRDH